jgi:ABC-type Fe3+-hydroxamate transport system substrate-binding protein
MADSTPTAANNVCTIEGNAMRSTPLIALVALALLAGCETNSEQQTATTASPSPVVTAAREVVATVEAVDPTERRVTLVGSDGQRRTLVLGSDVRNLDQVEVGDQVVVRYQEALAAELKEPGKPSQVGQVTASAIQAPLGAKPETEVSRQITATVRIENVDPDGPTVSFTGANGILRMIRVQDPNMQAFALTLKPGDEVDITYTEAIALSVEPASQ